MTKRKKDEGEKAKDKLDEEVKKKSDKKSNKNKKTFCGYCLMPMRSDNMKKH
jgi:hypothetical protein